MNKIYSFIILVLVFSALSAIEPDWETVRSYNSPYQDHGRVCAYDNQDNLYVAGTFTSQITIDGVQYSCTDPINGSFLDIFIAKFDSTNTCQWVKIFGGYDRDDIYGLKINDQGDIFIAGHVSAGVSFSDDFDPQVGYWDGFAAKLNTDGQFIWVNTFGNSTIDFVYDLEIDSHDNVYIAGHFQGIVNHGATVLTSQGDKDIFVTKIDSTGNFAWSVSAGGTGLDYAQALSIDEHQDSVEVYIGGSFSASCQFGNITPPSAGGRECFVARLDNNQNWDYVKSFVCGTRDWIGDIYVDENSCVFVGGSYTNNIVIDDYVLQTNYTGSNSFIFKMDHEGLIEWLEPITDNGSNVVYRITPGNDDNLIVCGMAGPDVCVGTSFTGASGSNQVYVADISTSGSWNWLKTNLQMTNIANDWHLSNIRCVDVNADGDIAVTGAVNGFSFFDNFGVQSCLTDGYEDDNDAFWAILHPDNTITDEDENTCQTYTNELIGNYPNPFNPETRIEFSLAEDTFVELSIYNIKGQRVKTFRENHFSKGDNAVIWNGQDNEGNPCSSGVYFFRLNTGKEIRTHKLLLLK